MALDAPRPPELSSEERQALGRLVWEAIRAEVSGGEPPAFFHEGRPRSPLARKLGVFVTLRRRGELRGCIGRVIPEESLAEGAMASAAAAATRDPRFLPVRAAELEDLEAEVTVLGPLRDLPASAEERLRSLCPGVHGLFMSAGTRRGVLLPQVATAFGWDAAEFLRRTALKAHLDELAWRDPEVRVAVFTATCFDAERPPAPPAPAASGTGE